MIQNVLQRIGGIEAYGILTILLFFAVFLAILVWACRLRAPYLNRMAAQPLDDPPAPEPLPSKPDHPHPPPSHD